MSQKQQFKVIIEMLEDAGCELLPHSKGHLKYKLPDGKFFIAPATPSAPCSYYNALAEVRRRLRPTHPEIANRGWTLPKNQRTTSNTIGEIIAAKEEQNLPEAEFEITATDPEETMPSTKGDHFSTRFPHLSRVEKDPQRMNGVVKTFPPEIIAEADRIGKEHGTAAMGGFLTEHRDDMIPAVRQTAYQRDVQYCSAGIDAQMASVISRAYAALKEVTLRLDRYEAQKAEIQAKQDEDVLKQTQLEEYIKRHEALADEAASLLGILPPVKVEPLRSHVAHPAARAGASQRMPYSMVEGLGAAYAILRGDGKKTFSIMEVSEAFERTALPLPHPIRNQVGNWLSLDVKRQGSIVEPAGERGMYRFKEGK